MQRFKAWKYAGWVYSLIGLVIYAVSLYLILNYIGLTVPTEIKGDIAMGLTMGVLGGTIFYFIGLLILWWFLHRGT